MPVEEDFMMDEFSTSAFENIGFRQPFDKTLVDTFRYFKGLKDRLQPGRLTPEGFAFVAMLSKSSIDKNPCLKSEPVESMKGEGRECQHSRKTDLFKSPSAPAS